MGWNRRPTRVVLTCVLTTLATTLCLVGQASAAVPHLDIFQQARAVSVAAADGTFVRFTLRRPDGSLKERLRVEAEEGAATAHFDVGLKPGDRLTVKRGGSQRTITILAPAVGRRRSRERRPRRPGDERANGPRDDPSVRLRRRVHGELPGRSPAVRRRLGWLVPPRQHRRYEPARLPARAGAHAFGRGRSLSRQQERAGNVPELERTLRGPVRRRGVRVTDRHPAGRPGRDGGRHGRHRRERRVQRRVP